MALAAIQALYDDDEEDDGTTRTTAFEEEAEDRMAVMNDPAFSVMSKIKLNLTPAIVIQVSEMTIDARYRYRLFAAGWHQ